MWIDHEFIEFGFSNQNWELRLKEVVYQFEKYFGFAKRSIWGDHVDSLFC